MSKVIAMIMAMVLSLSGCGTKTDSTTGTQGNETGSKDTGRQEENIQTNTERSRVMIKMADGGEIVVELIPEYAPATVENFLLLVKEGFYDGLIFHRVIPGFMIQGGDPEGTGMGGSDKNIKGEFASNGFKQNKLKHTRGVISMARSQHPDSASSQFFIMHEDAPHLDGDYAAFGKVVSGIEIVDKIAAVETNPKNDKPLEDVVIESIRVIEE